MSQIAHIAVFAKGLIESGGAMLRMGAVTDGQALSRSGSTIVSSAFAALAGNQTANFVFAGPTTGAAAAPTFRALVNADIPKLLYPASDSVTGFQVAKADGTTIILNVDTTNKRVGIGTAAPENVLHVRVSGASAIFDFDCYGTTSQNPQILWRKSEGTSASPAALSNASVMGQFNFQGAINTTPTFSAGILLKATTTEAWSVTNKGCKLEVSSIDIGTASVVIKTKVDDDGLSCLKGFLRSTTRTATDYVVLRSDYRVGVTDTSAARAITLPDPSTVGTDKEFEVKDESGGAAAHNITITGAAGNIDGAANVKITTNYGVVRVYSDGSNYFTR